MGRACRCGTRKAQDQKLLSHKRWDISMCTIANQVLSLSSYLSFFSLKEAPLMRSGKFEVDLVQLSLRCNLRIRITIQTPSEILRGITRNSQARKPIRRMFVQNVSRIKKNRLWFLDLFRFSGFFFSFSIFPASWKLKKPRKRERKRVTWWYSMLQVLCVAIVWGEGVSTHPFPHPRTQSECQGPFSKGH